MSGLWLLALFVTWAFVGWVLFRLWRRWRPVPLSQKIARFVIGLLLFSAWFGGAFWEVAGKKMYWDAKVRELCAVDGGVKVYETVELTTDLLDKFDRISIPEKSKAKPTDKYYFIRKNQYLRKNDPKILRMHTLVIRRNDEKLLGEIVRYGRGGGDLPGPWHPSNFTCPSPTEKPYLEPSIFIKGGIQ